ncbi:hypothetical protein Scep_028539 [Stephania cephalantha]|uniref:Uncharacterized protein n=1 Tax=Stephania cephalantha TaxID=152367 RepID=A0AAP0HLX0_9MAGN
MEYVAQKVGKLLECICDKGVRRVDNLINLSSNIKTFRETKIRELVAKASDMKAKLQIEIDQQKQPLEAVNLWLAKVEEAETKVDEAIKIYDKVDDVNCFVRLGQLLKLAENVKEELIKEVDELMATQFNDGLVYCLQPLILFSKSKRTHLWPVRFMVLGWINSSGLAKPVFASRIN